jgi:IclR family transcriptional regulator, blcABC operon repressor
MVTPAGERPRVPAIARTAAVFDAIMANVGDPMSLTDLSRELGIPKSSMANICHQLVDERFLSRVDGMYRLGPKLATLGTVYLASVDVVREFQDVCSDRKPGFDETVKLATLGEHGDIIYVARHDSGRPSALTLDFRAQQPAHCTASGKAMLACLPAADLDTWLEQRPMFARPTANSIGDENELRRAIEIARRCGHALDDEECIEGVFCVGTAMAAKSDNRDVLGISLALLKQRAVPERVTGLVGEVKRLARELADRLGHGYVTLDQRTAASISSP